MIFNQFLTKASFLSHEINLKTNSKVNQVLNKLSSENKTRSTKILIDEPIRSQNQSVNLPETFGQSPTWLSIRFFEVLLWHESNFFARSSSFGKLSEIKFHKIWHAMSLWPIAYGLPIHKIRIEQIVIISEKTEIANAFLDFKVAKILLEILLDLLVKAG